MIIELKNPYPESLFPSMSEDEMRIVNDAIREAGFTPDRVHGSWGRVVWNTCQAELAEWVLGWLQEEACNSESKPQTYPSAVLYKAREKLVIKLKEWGVELQQSLKEEEIDV